MDSPDLFKNTIGKLSGVDYTSSHFTLEPSDSVGGSPVRLVDSRGLSRVVSGILSKIAGGDKATENLVKAVRQLVKWSHDHDAELDVPEVAGHVLRVSCQLAKLAGTLGYDARQELQRCALQLKLQAQHHPSQQVLDQLTPLEQEETTFGVIMAPPCLQITRAALQRASETNRAAEAFYRHIETMLERDPGVNTIIIPCAIPSQLTVDEFRNRVRAMGREAILKGAWLDLSDGPVLVMTPQATVRDAAESREGKRHAGVERRVSSVSPRQPVALRIGRAEFQKFLVEVETSRTLQVVWYQCDFVLALAALRLPVHRIHMANPPSAETVEALSGVPELRDLTISYRSDSPFQDSLDALARCRTLSSLTFVGRPREDVVRAASCVATLRNLTLKFHPKERNTPFPRLDPLLALKGLTSLAIEKGRGDAAFFYESHFWECIGQMQTLQELSVISVSHEGLKHIAQLNNLQSLTIRESRPRLRSEDLYPLVKSLTNLEWLKIDGREKDVANLRKSGK